jgi:hypothetical protein
MAHHEDDPQDFLYEKLEEYFLGPMGWTFERLDTYIQSIQHLGPPQEFILLIETILNQWIGDISRLYISSTHSCSGVILDFLIRRNDLEIKMDLPLAALGFEPNPFLASMLDVSECTLRISGDGSNVCFGVDILASNFFKSSFFDPIKSLPKFSQRMKGLTSKIIGPQPELIFKLDPIINPDMRRLDTFLQMLLQSLPGLTIFFTFCGHVTVVQTISAYEHNVRSLADKVPHLLALQ